MTFIIGNPSERQGESYWKPRNGVSLIEMLVVIAISTILLGVVSVTLVAMYDISRDLQNVGSTPWGTPQLIEHLRQDIASATQTKWDKETQQLAILGANLFGSEAKPVKYEFSGSLCTRCSDNEDGKEIKQRYKLPESVSLLVEPTVANPQDLLRITLMPNGKAKPSIHFIAMNELVVLVGRNTNRLVAGGVE